MSNSCNNFPLTPDNDNYPALGMPTQAETDKQLIELWLHGRSRHTQKAYQLDIDRFYKFINLDLYLF